MSEMFESAGGRTVAGSAAQTGTHDRPSAPALDVVTADRSTDLVTALEPHLVEIAMRATDLRDNAAQAWSSPDKAELARQLSADLAEQIHAAAQAACRRLDAHRAQHRLLATPLEEGLCSAAKALGNAACAMITLMNLADVIVSLLPPSGAGANTELFVAAIEGHRAVAVAGTAAANEACKHAISQLMEGVNHAA
jgi:hypothetical protein